MKQTIRKLLALLVVVAMSSDSAWAQVAKIGEVTYASLQAAFDVVPGGTTTTIDIIDDINEPTTSRGDWSNPNIVLNLQGHSVTIGGMSGIASLTINGGGGKLTLKNSDGISNANGGNDQTLTIDNATVVLEDGMQWMAASIKLQNNTGVTVSNRLYLGYANDPNVITVNIDATSQMKLKNCSMGASSENQAYNALINYVREDLKASFATANWVSTKFSLTLRSVHALELKHTFGTNAAVTFYKSAAEPTTAFVDAPGTAVTTANAGDWIVVHIVPNDFYWTDLTLLCAYEAAGALARTRAIGVDPPQSLKLLKADTYEDTTSDPAVTKDRHDGAGWYYYQIPAEHSLIAGYTSSVIDGYMANKFNLSDGAVDIIGTVITVTGIKDPLLLTPNDWTAEFTYDQLSYVFDATPHKPTLQSVVIKKAGVKIIELTGDAITKQVKQPEAQIGISSQHGLCLEPANSDYTWFYGMVSPAVGACFKITIPFGGSGTVDDPWQIKTAADLNMLSKCSNIGRYKFEGEYLKQMNTEPIDMSGVTDFIPICLGSDEGLAFRGIYDGDGRTICNLTCNHVEPAYYINYGYVGLFGFVDGGTIQNVVLKDCKFTTSFNASAMGGIAGYVKKGTLSGNRVTGDCSISNSIDNGGITGAIVGMTEGDNTTLTIKNNKYDYTVGVSRKDGSGTTETASGYTKRGYWTGTAWADITVDEGAMLNVKKATVPAANGNGSAVTFNQVTKGVDRYDSTGDDFYYAVGQSISVTVTPGVSKPDGDIRTFYDQLNTLTMNGTDIKDALSFAMPDADATIAATFALSDWFTIDSNQKEWMSFYHKWEPTVAMNYSVTDGSGTGKTISALTITDINLSNGSVTTGDLGGVSFNGMPTLFHCKNGLPEKLKFTPDANASTNVTPSRYFSGTAEKMDMSSYTNVYVMNGIGDFYFAEDKSVQLAAHRCYVDLGSTAIVAPARLHIVDGEATGIETPSLTPSLEGAGIWYSLDGRKLDGKPTKKGLYINNGRTIVIK